MVKVFHPDRFKGFQANLLTAWELATSTTVISAIVVQKIIEILILLTCCPVMSFAVASTDQPASENPGSQEASDPLPRDLHLSPRSHCIFGKATHVEEDIHNVLPPAFVRL